MSLNKIERAQGLRIRSQQDFAAGLFIVGLGLLAIFLSWDLPMGSLRQIGAGMLPKSIATICIALGLLLALSSLRYNGDRLSGWSWRGVIFVLGGTILFGMTIRGFELGPLSIPPLGMIISGPLVMLVAGIAATDVKPKELVIFTLAMTTACVLLFKYALSLPIPLAPWLLGI